MQANQMFTRATSGLRAAGSPPLVDRDRCRYVEVLPQHQYRRKKTNRSWQKSTKELETYQVSSKIFLKFLLQLRLAHCKRGKKDTV